MALLTQEELDKLRVDNGEIWHVRGKNSVEYEVPWEIVFRKPARKDYKFFRANASNPAKQPEAQEILLRSCILVPELKNFDALLDRFPGIPECEAVSEALKIAVGMSGDEAEKK